MNQTDQLISEILQIKEQYEAQVAGKYKQWPRAIKDRVAALVEADLRLTTIAKRTGISYHTLISWRYKELKQPFREVSVIAPNKKLATVTKESRTVTSSKELRSVAATGKSIAVTIRTPDRLSVSVSPIQDALLILRGLSQSRLGRV